MSDSNRVQIAMVAESSYGVQKTGSNLQILRHTGESFKQDQQTTQSNEIRADRQISGIKRTNLNAGGGFNFEFSYDAYDALLLAALMHSPTAVTVTAATISASATDNSFNDSGNGFGSLVAGQIIQVTGFTGDVANNGFFRIASVPSAGKIIVTGGTLVNDTAGESVTIKMGDWSTAITVSGTGISASASDNSFNDTGNGFGNLAVGQWIKVSGFTGAGATANNKFFKIVSKTAGKIVVTGGTLVDDAAGETVTIKQGSSAFNGTTKTSFNIERTYLDLSSELALYLGMMVEQFGLNISVDQIITGSVDFIGKLEQSIASSGGSGYTAATTKEVFNAVDDVYSILENMTAMDAYSLGFQIKNNLRGKQKIGTLGAFEVGVGSVNVSGQLTAYYGSKTLIDKYLNQTLTSFSFVVKDAAGNAYVFDMPAVKFSRGERPGGSLNSDVMATLDYTAYMHATEGITIRVAKFPAA
jgi:hypothetical protein